MVFLVINKLTKRRFNLLININIIYKTKVRAVSFHVQTFFSRAVLEASHHYFFIGAAHIQGKIIIEIQ